MRRGRLAPFVGPPLLHHRSWRGFSRVGEGRPAPNPSDRASTARRPEGPQAGPFCRASCRLGRACSKSARSALKPGNTQQKSTPTATPAANPTPVSSTIGSTFESAVPSRRPLPPDNHLGRRALRQCQTRRDDRATREITTPENTPHNVTADETARAIGVVRAALYRTWSLARDARPHSALRPPRIAFGHS